MMVDVAFQVRGTTIPRDHAYSLFHALVGRLEWLRSEPLAGVHAIRGTVSAAGNIFLGLRAKLVLRLTAERAEQALAGLTGARLGVGSGLEVGEGRIRELLPFATQYSRLVSTGSADETEFLAEAASLLKQAGLPDAMICGKAHRALTPQGDICGFSLLLHGLTAAQSLAVQENGLGGGRALGCGIFVPHKSIAVVGT
jgi:CRISPR-associated protein Cas6